METSRASYTARISPERDEPITGTITWTIAKGMSWRVDAITGYGYYHHRYYTVYGGLEDTYDIFHFHTGQPYFVGSNNLINSTYTTQNIDDHVLNNDTRYAVGKAFVQGTIRHVMNIFVRLPFCESLKLDQTDEIQNSLDFYPR